MLVDNINLLIPFGIYLWYSDLIERYLVCKLGDDEMLFRGTKKCIISCMVICQIDTAVRSNLITV